MVITEDLEGDQQMREKNKANILKRVLIQSDMFEKDTFVVHLGENNEELGTIKKEGESHEAYSYFRKKSNYMHNKLENCVDYLIKCYEKKERTKKEQQKNNLLTLF